MKTKHSKKEKLKRLGTCIMILLFSTGLKSQVTIGSGSEPAVGALLDLKQYVATADNQTADKGILYPRVVLTDKNELYPMYSATDPEYTDPVKKVEIFKNHTGLTVYNSKENGDFMEGLHVWSGSSWRRIDDSDVLEPSITSLLCSSITVTPNSYIANPTEEFVATVKLPYLGGNGARYSGTAPSSAVNGLQIERIGGKLAIGGGEIMYRVFGYPTVSSPTVTIFPITFLGQTCHIEVGSGTSSLQLKSLTNDVYVDVPLGSPSDPTQLAFGDIIITESGSYAFSLRLYGRLSGMGAGSAGRFPFYIYLQKNGTSISHIIDAAEIDIVTAGNTYGYDDYSYSVTLGGSFQAGDKIYIGMNKPGSGPAWTLRWGDAESANPIRTSLIYWKL